MNISTFSAGSSAASKAGLGIATLALAAGAVVAGTLGGGAQAAPGNHTSIDAGVTAASAHVASPAVAGKGGWQGAYTYTVPTGTTGLFFHYGCPSGFVARSGLVDVNATGQASVKIVGQGPRFDLGYTEWFNNFTFAGGAPAGTSINFDVYCTKAPA